MHQNFKGSSSSKLDILALKKLPIGVCVLFRDLFGKEDILQSPLTEIQRHALASGLLPAPCLTDQPFHICL